MKENVKISVIGLGGRGFSLLKDVMLQMKDVEVLGVCDLYEDRAKAGADAVREAKGNNPVCSLDYKEVINIDEIDAVIITSAWESHIQIAVDAMRAGKYVGMEVGGAYSIEDCWELVKVSEETGIPCMMLENCCYGRTEMMVLNMVKQGVLGEIVHCQGGYHHDLRSEIATGIEKRHYRLRNYLNRNCENYPTHELGPIAKVLNLGRGNRMVSLTSMSSKAVGMHEYIVNKYGEDSELAKLKFEQGDIVVTTIKCAHGELITLTLDTTLPRSYNRGFTVRGTKGFYQEENNSVFIEGVHDEYRHSTGWKFLCNNAEEFYEKYDHPIWKEYAKTEIRGGHEGMDWLVFRALFESVKEGIQTPIDVYDTVSWMCISALSEKSIALGGAPVDIPDFTRGKWVYREDYIDRKYCLDKICVQEEISII